MKILFITSSSINGGAQKHIKEMYKSLTAFRHEVYLVAPDGWLVDELKEYGEKIIPLDLSIRNKHRLEKLIERIHPEITNTFILSGGVFGTLAWKKRKYGKLFITVNNPVIYPGISTAGKMLYPRLYRWLSMYASAFLVKSDKVRDEVASVIKNIKPVISIKNGIDFSVFDKDRVYPDIRNDLGISSDDIVVTNVAALDTRKGQEYLIQAVNELRNYPIHILLVGDGADENRLRNLTNELNVSSRVHFLGRRSDVSRILANSDIFILPSLHEGLPNALMEAMAMGLPCIATDVGGVRQLIRDRNMGIIIEPKSERQIFDAIQKYIHNKTFAKECGKNASDMIRQEYELCNVSEELKTIYAMY